jgi:GNAT superfamily N-acetyltransferase
MPVDHLDAGEIGQASHLLARAFAEDPIITHYLDDPVRRAVAFPAFFEGVLEEMIPSAEVWACRSGGDLVGVAGWLPPDPIEPDTAAAARAEGARQIVERVFPDEAAALYGGFDALSELHPADPHWYLGFVGIEPDLQGRGLGRELLKPVLNMADETGSNCYLETPFPGTHRFYEGLGFTRDSEHFVFSGAKSGVVTFIREPRPSPG